MFLSDIVEMFTVDPGLRACGIAHFWGAKLSSAWLEESRCVSADHVLAAVKMGRQVCDGVLSRRNTSSVNSLLVSELPVLRRGSPVDPNDIMHLYSVVVAVRANTGIPMETVTPSTWKGTVPKKIFLERILKCLTDEERQRLPKLPASKLHNVIDAVGIGLWKLGRLNAKGK